MKAYRLTGADLTRALDLLHVHVDLAGVWEQEDALVVWLHDPLPAVLRELRIQVEELPASASAPSTGRERDGPVLVAEDLLVRPPWVRRPDGYRGLELVVPRGSAFGSGEHASTRAALRCLHALWQPVASFADIGTGSGILALYAVQRGTAVVMACDVDPSAVRAARELLPHATVVEGGPARLAPADGVVANLNVAELTQALDEILACWTGRGLLVISGLRRDETAPIAARLPRAPDHVEEVEEFRALGLTRRVR